MELKVFDRIMLLNILPKEGDYRTLKQLRLFREALAFTDEENAALAFEDDGAGMIQWKTESDMPVEIAIAPPVREAIVTVLKRLDAQKKLREDQMGLYERFMDAGALTLVPSDEE